MAWRGHAWTSARPRVGEVLSAGFHNVACPDPADTFPIVSWRHRSTSEGETEIATTTVFSAYRSALERELGTGFAIEHSYRGPLAELIEGLGDAKATNEPKRSACGAPDYTVWKQTGHGPMTIGYIEAKDIGVPLGNEERSDQMSRYLPALDNLILTDYLEFRWYVGGQHERTAVFGTIEDDDVVLAKGGQKAVEDLLHDFLAKKPVEIKSPPELARRMARLTHLIRDVIVQAFRDDAETKTTQDLRDAFSEVLIPEISVPEFADMFAQTIAYGLFAARTNHTLGC
jgi:hypothetical protein